MGKSFGQSTRKHPKDRQEDNHAHHGHQYGLDHIGINVREGAPGKHVHHDDDRDQGEAQVIRSPEEHVEDPGACRQLGRNVKHIEQTDEGGSHPDKIAIVSIPQPVGQGEGPLLDIELPGPFGNRNESNGWSKDNR